MMDADDIGVVLQKAAELRRKLTGAIERAVKAEYRLMMGGGCKNTGMEQEALGDLEPDSYRRRIVEGDYGYGNIGDNRGQGNMEARTLAGVRDAVELLEDQLESLQTLQQQQLVERDAVLDKLEESRNLLIKRLRNHHGVELEVVHEALAFAGEPVGEGDELPLPPYPMPLNAHSPEMDRPISMRGIHGPVKRLILVHSRDEGSGQQTDGNRCSDEDIVLKKAVTVRNSTFGFRPFLAKFVGDFFGKAVGSTARMTMLAATVITIIFFANVQQQSTDQKSAKAPSKMNKISSKKPPISLGPINPLKQEEICPPGRVMIMQDGHPRCVVKERTEIPFHKEIQSPDVFYGRG